jgi:hypothetical protein
MRMSGGQERGDIVSGVGAGWRRRNAIASAETALMLGSALMVVAALRVAEGLAGWLTPVVMAGLPKP